MFHDADDFDIDDLIIQEGNVSQNVSIQATAQTNRDKNIIPGPAGSNRPFKITNNQRNKNSINTLNLFQSMQWFQMCKDLPQIPNNPCILNVYNIRWVRENVNKIIYKKVPFLATVITRKQVVKHSTGWSIQLNLKDQTDEIICFLLSDSNTDVSTKLLTNCVVVLKNASVISNGYRKQYLIISSSNIVNVYAPRIEMQASRIDIQTTHDLFFSQTQKRSVGDWVDLNPSNFNTQPSQVSNYSIYKQNTEKTTSVIPINKPVVANELFNKENENLASQFQFAKPFPLKQTNKSNRNLLKLNKNVQSKVSNRKPSIFDNIDNFSFDDLESISTDSTINSHEINEIDNFLNSDIQANSSSQQNITSIGNELQIKNDLFNNKLANLQNDSINLNRRIATNIISNVVVQEPNKTMINDENAIISGNNMFMDDFDINLTDTSLVSQESQNFVDPDFLNEFNSQFNENKRINKKRPLVTDNANKTNALNSLDLLCSPKKKIPCEKIPDNNFSRRRINFEDLATENIDFSLPSVQTQDSICYSPIIGENPSENFSFTNFNFSDGDLNTSTNFYNSNISLFSQNSSTDIFKIPSQSNSIQMSPDICQIAVNRRENTEKMSNHNIQQSAMNLTSVISTSKNAVASNIAIDKAAESVKVETPNNIIRNRFAMFKFETRENKDNTETTKNIATASFNKIEATKTLLSQSSFTISIGKSQISISDIDLKHREDVEDLFSGIDTESLLDDF